VSVYGSAVKRLSKAQARELDHHLLAIAAQEKPTSVRGMYYMAMGAGLIDKDVQTKRNNYMRIQRRLLQMRRDGTMPYSWITDGSRTVYGYDRFADEDDFSTYAANIYRKDYWLESPVRVEVWVEKDAMAGKLKPVVRDEYGEDVAGMHSERCARPTGRKPGRTPEVSRNAERGAKLRPRWWRTTQYPSTTRPTIEAL
jgi:hypothetical protein